MKMDLQCEQAAVYEITGGFLRTDRSDDFLWISDYPRRHDDLKDAEQKLAALGVVCVTDDRKMWHLDWTEEKWETEIGLLPASLPPFPAEEALHDAYAFCRFALRHPAKRTPESLRMLRSVLKNSKTLRQLHEEAAMELRCGRAIAYDAGRFLAKQLMKGEYQG